jgi:HEAT repeat protein
MSYPGGTADKLGNYYESLWTIRCILKMLMGDYIAIEIESLKEEDEGAEFVLYSQEKREYHQVKRHHPNGKWTLNSLNESKVLKTFWNKFQHYEDAVCYFVSMSDAYELRELSERARKFNWGLFQKIGLNSEIWNERYQQLSRHLSVSDDSVFNGLQRAFVRSDNEETLLDTNNIAIQRLFQVSANDADAIAALLAQYILQNLGERIEPHAILSFLSQKGFVVSQVDAAISREDMALHLESLIERLSTKDVFDYIELEASYLEEQEEIEWEPEFSLLVTQKNSENLIKKRIANIQDAVNSFDRFVLVGLPGAGKTTTLKRLTVNAAQRCSNDADLKSAPLPIYISLPSWNDEPNIEDFIRSQLRIEGDIIEMLYKGTARLFIDGLNEMGSSGIGKVQQLKYWLKGQDRYGNDNLAILPPKFVAITCRKEDYVGDFVLDHFTVIEVDELSDSQIRQFAYHYSSGNETIAEKFLQQIFDTKQTRKNLTSLANSPYKLKALYLQYQHYDEELPSNAGLLSNRRVKLLWELKVKRSSKYNVTYQEAERSLARLAFAMIDANTPTTVTRQYAKLYIDNNEIIEAARDIILKVEGETISFEHQLTQEYFAAEALKTVDISHITLSYPADLVKEPINASLPRFTQSRFGEFKLSEKWNQVVVAICGILENPEEMILKVAKINPYLAMEALKSGVNVPTIDLVPSFIQALGHSNINVVGKAIEVLGVSNDVRASESLLHYLDSPIRELQLAAENSLSSLGLLAVDSLVRELKNRPSENEKLRITRILIRAGTIIVPKIIEISLTIDKSYLSFIYRIIGQIGDEVGSDFLISIATNNSGELLEKAIEALGYTGNIKAIKCLTELLFESNQGIQNQILSAFESTITKLKVSSLQVNRQLALKNLDYIASILNSALNSLALDVEQIKYICGLLENIPTKTSIYTLATLLSNTNWDIHISAFISLRRLSKTAAPSKSRARNLTNMFRSLKSFKHQDSSLLKIHKSLGSVGLLHALRHVTTHRNYTIGHDIKRILSRISASEMYSLLSFLKSPSVYVRMTLVEAISEGGFKNAAEEITPLLRDKNALIRGHAAIVLGNSDNPSLIPLLEELLNDNEVAYNQRFSSSGVTTVTVSDLAKGSINRLTNLT